MIILKILLLLSYLLISILTACSFAPKYQQPILSIPKNFKETGRWLKTTMTVKLKNPKWWLLFHDKILNDLEQQVTCNNQNIKIALARYQKACALVQVARSDYYPTIMGISNIVRQKNSTTNANAGHLIPLYDIFMFGADLGYELDAWGRIRNKVAASKSLARASEFDIATMTLSMHAELAKDYFMLRGEELARQILDATVITYKKALHLTKKRYEGGAAAIADV